MRKKIWHATEVVWRLNFFVGVICCCGDLGPLIRADECVVDTESQFSQLREAIEEVRVQAEIPGLVYAYTQGLDVVELKALGIRKVGDETPMTAEDLMHIGSCTKAMTAALLATLVAERKLAWSTKLVDLFPSASEMIHPDYHAVTLELLLRHRAGLPANISWGELVGNTATEQRYDMLSRVLAKPAPTTPATAFGYSNVGYALAGLMAEKVTGKSWEQLMTERIFTPLGMTSAGFGPPGPLGKVKQPWGHRQVQLEFVPDQVDNPPSLGPAGTVHCSVADWAKFAQIFTNDGRKENPVLEESMVERLVSLVEKDDRYALGWTVVDRKWADGVTYSHRGSNTRWYCNVWISPELNLTFLVAANVGNAAAGRACDTVVVKMLEHLKLLK